ncbi:helix-turn-helix domain-containing protein [Arabiibacter massiliensis]|uniref:helix-turn-helix domain-containing protein n=1 Tax=Arabiibacter massiliensis TaxID=1870985 RepID=UPI0009BBD6B1|nr:helix-turn-helix transcriptional regulator [Arabiibacter massiliensis]
MQGHSSERTYITSWSAAKYLSYAFWRAWFLVMYSSPVWLSFVVPEGVNPGLQMYYLSTVCFVAASVILSVLHAKTVELFSLKGAMVAFGAGASAGVVMEFAALMLWHDPGSWLFWLGSGLTGICTAPIAIRAGQIYASVRVNTAVIGTLLSDVAAGLIFFFCIGTWPIVCLFIAAALPLLSAVMIVITTPSGDGGAVDIGTATAGALSRKSFLRFLVVVFLIGAVAFLQNGLGNSWFSQASLDSGLTLGVSLLVMVSFALAVFFAIVQKVQFETLYRPIIFCLIAFVAVAYLLDFGNPVAIGGTFLVYCLFSSYIWVFMSYLGHSRYFSPVQVFGYGRSAYAGGSLLGCLLGVYVLPQVDLVRALPVIVVVMIGILLLCAVAIRQVDISSILVQDAAEKRSDSHPAKADAAAAPVEADQLGDVHLSPRELEVFALMRAGRDSEYIANSLCVSRNTAKTHIRNIYAKFGVHRRQDFIDVIQKL